MDKLNTINKLSEVLNAGGAVLVSTRKNCDNRALSKELRSYNVKCVSFENLCAGTWRLTRDLFGSP